jgi:hypothetical protein
MDRLKNVKPPNNGLQPTTGALRFQLLVGSGCAPLAAEAKPVL